MANKTLWDISVGTHNCVAVWHRGFFEKCNQLSMVEWNDDDYIEIENYRFHKRDLDRPAIKKFLKQHNLSA